MLDLSRVRTYVSDARKTLVDVNQQMYALDPLYVTYNWIASIFSSLQTLTLFIVGSAFVGQIIQTSAVNWTHVLIGIGALSIYLSASVIVSSYADERRELLERTLSMQLEQKTIHHLANMDVGRLVDPDFAETTIKARWGMHSIQGLWSDQITLVSAAFALVMCSAILVSLDPIIGVLALGFAVPSIMHAWIKEKTQRELFLKKIQTNRERNEIQRAINHPYPSVLTKMLLLTQPYLKIHHELTQLLFADVHTLARLEKKWALVTGFVNLVCIVLICTYFASGIVGGKYTYVELGPILGSFRLVGNSIRTFGVTSSSLEHDRRSYNYLRTFFNTKPLVDESSCKPVVFKKAPELVIENVTFAYPNQTKNAIEDCSIKIDPGEKVAFVGANGCGKTTLLRLISRIYLPTSGRVWADGTPLDSVTQSSWLTHSAMITQGASLPELDLMRALTGGNRSEANMDRVGKALVFSRADQVVKELPSGLETWIGAQWSNGHGFSTGQLQRFLLAAAFYRLLDTNCHIAMFDEPTANCDAETKQRFYSSVNKSFEFEKKTVIVSLHDPLYLEFFDLVLHFDSGKLVSDLREKKEIQAYKSKIALALAHDL